MNISVDTESPLTNIALLYYKKKTLIKLGTEAGSNGTLL